MRTPVAAVLQYGGIFGQGHLTRLKAVLDGPELREIPVLVHQAGDATDQARSYLDQRNVHVVTHQGELLYLLRHFQPRVLILDGAALDTEALTSAANASSCVILSSLLKTPSVRTLHIHRSSSIPPSWRPKSVDAVCASLQYAVVPSYVENLVRRPAGSMEDAPQFQSLAIMSGSGLTEELTCELAWQVSRMSALAPVLVMVAGDATAVIAWLMKHQFAAKPRVEIVNGGAPWEHLVVAHRVIATAGQSLIEAIALGIDTVALPVNHAQQAIIGELVTKDACRTPMFEEKRFLPPRPPVPLDQRVVRVGGASRVRQEIARFVNA